MSTVAEFMAFCGENREHLTRLYWTWKASFNQRSRDIFMPGIIPEPGGWPKRERLLWYGEEDE